MTTVPKREKEWRALGPQRLDVFGQSAFKTCDAIGVEELTGSSSVQQSRRRTEVGLASLSRVSSTNPFDSCSNAPSLGSVPEPGAGAELHSFLGTLNIRHKSLLDRYLEDFVAGKPREEGQSDQRLGAASISN